MPLSMRFAFIVQKPYSCVARFTHSRSLGCIAVFIMVTAGTLLVGYSPQAFADTSDVGDCSGSFSGTLSEPFNADPLITINASKGNYDVEFDYVVVNGDDGTGPFVSHFVNPSALEPSEVIFVEGETISMVLTSAEAIGVGTSSIRLFHKAISDCDILFTQNLPDSMRIFLPLVNVTEMEPSKFLVEASIPDKESTRDFTKLVIAYVTNPDASVSYNVRNVSIVVADGEVPSGTIADATNQATGQSMYAGGRMFYGEKFGSKAAIISSVVDCAAVELRRHGSPTGTAEIGFYDPNMNLIKQFGTIEVSMLTTGYKAYEFCLPSSASGHTILANQILAVKFNDGDSVNRIDVRRSNTGGGPDYDGLQSYHVNFDGIWRNYDRDSNSRDLLFKLTNYEE